MELSSVHLGEVLPLARPTGSSDRRRRRALFYAIILASDVVALFLGFAAAGTVRFDHPLHTQAITLLTAMLPVYLAFNSRSYVPEVLDDWRPGAWRAVFSLVLAAVMVMFIAFFLKAATELSRILTVVAIIASALLLSGFRAVIGRVSRRVFDGSAKGRLLIIDELAIDAPAGVAVLRADRFDLSDRATQPLMLDLLARHLDGVDDAFIACPPERRRMWAMAMKGSAVRTELLVPELDSFGAIGNETFAGVASVLVSAGTLRLRDRVTKRVLDLALVIPAIVVLAPLMIVIAVAIRLDSPGAALFVQQRVGKGNRLFPMFKFRSMRFDAGDGDGRVSTSRDDGRITRVGRFIRATSIDELPQLFNILRGEMSFVGPRPHAIGSLAGDQLFWEADHRYTDRHACKPGLTGLAQVRGLRGATHRREDLVSRLDADLDYINGWSVKRDLSILLATLRVVIHDNAY